MRLWTFEVMDGILPHMSPEHDVVRPLSPTMHALVGETVGVTFELVGRMRAHFERVAAEFDLTPSQARALRVLDEPCAMGDVAARLHCDPSNVTGIVDRLEERGLVERRVDPADRRRKMIAVTEAGRDLHGRLHERLVRDRPGVASLSADELRTFRELARKAAAAFPTLDN